MGKGVYEGGSPQAPEGMRISRELDDGAERFYPLVHGVTREMLACRLPGQKGCPWFGKREYVPAAPLGELARVASTTMGALYAAVRQRPGKAISVSAP